MPAPIARTLLACCTLVALAGCENDLPVPRAAHSADAVAEIRGLNQLQPIQALDRCDAMASLPLRIECFERVGRGGESIAAAVAPRG